MHRCEQFKVQVQQVKFPRLKNGAEGFFAFGQVACGVEDVRAGGFEGANSR